MKKCPVAVLAGFVAASLALAGEEAPAPAPPPGTGASAPAGGGGAEALEPGGPEAPALKSRITAVTLYSRQALVVRKGAAELPAGRSRLEVPELPAALLSEAVRARILEGNGARLANIEVRERHKTIFKKKEAEEADQALKEILARRRAATDAMAALDREAALLGSFEVGKPPEGKPDAPRQTPIDPGAWEATLKFVDEALAENRKRHRELAAEMDGIEDDLAVAADRARRLSSRQVKSEKAVVLEIECEAATGVELEVAYLVPGPGWWPRYDIRADVEKKKIELTSYALVRQESGEDWEDVELTFSAAEPARAADLPELLTWHIGEGRVAQREVATSFGLSPPSQSAESPKPQVAGKEFKNTTGLGLEKAQGQGKASPTQEALGRIESQQRFNEEAARNNDWGAYFLGNCAVQEEIQSLGEKYQNLFAEDLAEATSNIARGKRLLKSARFASGLVMPVLSSRGYDFKYHALRPESVPSDGAFNKVVVGVEEFPAEFAYQSSPAKRELFFLVSRIANQRRQPYLEGPSSVFLGPDFVGDGRVATTARGESFPVELGVDESVAVKRREDSKRENTGLFTSWHKYQHQVEVTVKNQKSRAVRAVVIERVPFSEEKNLTVERGAISPAPAKEDRKGLLRFELDLAPGEEKKVSLSYSVELPADRGIFALEDSSVSW